MIQERYLNEAIRIRTEYLSTLKSIQDKEILILNHKDDINNILKDSSELVANVKNKKINEEQAKVILNQKLMDIEENIIKIQNQLNPYNDKIEELKNQSKILYSTIAEKYPQMNEKEIQMKIYEKLNDLFLI